MDNSQFKRAVLAELGRIPELPPITVEASDGIVVLSGRVADAAQLKLVEQRLLALPQVMDVHNYLRVALPPDGLDDQLRALLRREAVDDTGLQVEVAGGRIRLSGRAASWFDRDAMERFAWTLPGVDSVENSVEIPTGSPDPEAQDAGLPSA